MAAKKKTSDKESTGPGGDGLRAASSQYRTMAGLEDKELGSPSDLTRHEGGKEAPAEPTTEKVGDDG